jgi:hypothetical protein
MMMKQMKMMMMLIYEEPSSGNIFDVTVAETNGTNKPFVRTNGIFFFY